MFLNQTLVYYSEHFKKYAQNYIYNFQIKKQKFLLLDILRSYLVFNVLKTIGNNTYLKKRNKIKSKQKKWYQYIKMKYNNLQLKYHNYFNQQIYINIIKLIQEQQFSHILQLINIYQ